MERAEDVDTKRARLTAVLSEVEHELQQGLPPAGQKPDCSNVGVDPKPDCGSSRPSEWRQRGRRLTTPADYRIRACGDADETEMMKGKLVPVRGFAKGWNVESHGITA